jgi:methyl coenzyme M reductase subunit D
MDVTNLFNNISAFLIRFEAVVKNIIHGRLLIRESVIGPVREGHEENEDDRREQHHFLCHLKISDDSFHVNPPS